MKFNIPLFNRVSFLDKVLFARHLALMIKAGLPLRSSIVAVKEQSKSRRFRNVLDDVIKSIERGQSLAVSLSRHSDVFGSLYINMIKIGEESGTLEQNLDNLAHQLEKKYELRKRIKAAMIYPAIIVTAVIGLSVALVFFVLPKITPLFETFDIQLPLTTRILIKTTFLLQSYGLFVLVGIVGLAIFLFFLSKIKLMKALFYRILFFVPVAGKISRDVNITYFNYTLGTLLKSGVSVISALEITGGTLNNLVYKKEIKKIAEEVKKGKSISSYLRKKEKLFPLIVSRMIGIGEKTGKLDETLLYIGNFYEVEIDRTTKTLSSILEPVLLLIVGLMVGFIALAIISPIYEITRGFQF